MIHTTFERLPQEKRDRIIQAARTEFIRYPYEKTSINRILAEAEVPKGSFYQYFDDKSDLFSLCTCAVYRKLIDARKRNGEPLLEFGMLRMKKLGYDKGYQAFSKDLERYLSEEDFKLFENMMEAPRHIRNYVQMNAGGINVCGQISITITTHIFCHLRKSFPWITAREPVKKWKTSSFSDTSICGPFTTAFCNDAFTKNFRRLRRYNR